MRDEDHPDNEVREDEVRELLAALGRTTDPDRSEDAAPLPDDVAQRLDDVLAGLVAARTAERTAAPVQADAEVVRLPRRRGWLAAAGIAAATVLAAVAVPQVVGGSSGSGTMTASESRDGPAEVMLSGPLVEQEAPDDDLSAESRKTDSDGQSFRSSARVAPYSSVPSRAPLAGSPELARDTLADDVVELLGGLADTSPVPRPAGPELPATSSSGAASEGGSSEELSIPGPDAGYATSDDDTGGPACRWGGRGQAYAVSLDDRRALAVVTGRGDADRVVRLLLCRPSGTTVEVATAVVPAALLPSARD